MQPKTMAKAAVTTAIGVMLAGYIMYQFRDISIMAQASAGFDRGL